MDVNPAVKDFDMLWRNPEIDIVHPQEGHDSSEMLSVWRGYHKKTTRERQDEINLVYPELDTQVLNTGGIDMEIADIMVENCVGKLALPVGIAPNFIINGQHFVVPMCVEEPSVIAAASSAAKVVARSGGFVAQSTGNIMTGQIQILDIDDLEATVQKVSANKKEMIDVANTFCQSMKKRGGGVIDVNARIVRPRGDARNRRVCKNGHVVVHFEIDVCEAMGANIVNTVAEGLASYIGGLTGGRIGLKILTNLAINRRTKAQFRIPLAKLGWKGVEGRMVADRLLEAYYFALDDPFRAATNNKGIFNGMDAVALALGQDWRAIEAGGHAWAARTGHYSPLAMYEVQFDPQLKEDVLIGTLEMPMAVGSKGGALGTHPSYRFGHDLLKNPNAQTISQIIASLGLAQNFAAMRALAIEGIQKGHMGLHARNIAVAAGVPSGLVPEVAAYMVTHKKVNAATARQYMESQSIYSRRKVRRGSKEILPSTLLVELATPNFPEPIVINVAFNSVLPNMPQRPPIHFRIAQGAKTHKLHNELFGEKGYEWLQSIYSILDRIKLTTKTPPRTNDMQQAKLKLVSIILNVLTNQLMMTFPKETSTFLEMALKLAPEFRERALEHIPTDNDILVVGYPMILALWRTFEYQTEQWVKAANPNLAEVMLQEQHKIMRAIHFRMTEVAPSGAKRSTADCMEHFFKVHGKRWQATMILLCDSLSISPLLLSEERLNFVRSLGEYFELEGTISHDIDRAERDASAGVPNSYLLWCKLKGLKHNGAKTQKKFLQFVEQLMSHRRQHILSYEHDADFFDAKLFLRTSQHIRQYYIHNQSSSKEPRSRL